MLPITRSGSEAEVREQMALVMSNATSRNKPKPIMRKQTAYVIVGLMIFVALISSEVHDAKVAMIAEEMSTVTGEARMPPSSSPPLAAEKDGSSALLADPKGMSGIITSRGHNSTGVAIRNTSSST